MLLFLVFSLSRNEIVKSNNKIENNVSFADNNIYENPILNYDYTKLSTSTIIPDNNEEHMIIATTRQHLKSGRSYKYLDLSDYGLYRDWKKIRLNLTYNYHREWLEVDTGYLKDAYTKIQPSILFNSYEQEYNLKTEKIIEKESIHNFAIKPTIKIKDLIEISGIGYEYTKKTKITEKESSEHNFKLDENMPKGYYTLVGIHQIMFHRYNHMYGRKKNNKITRNIVGKNHGETFYGFSSEIPAIGWIYTGQYVMS